MPGRSNSDFQKNILKIGIVFIFSKRQTLDDMAKIENRTQYDWAVNKVEELLPTAPSAETRHVVEAYGD